MFLKGQANFISQRNVVGKNNVYYFAKFDDGKSGEFEVQLDKPLDCKRFALYDFVTDVIQGKYPRFKLVDLSEVK